MTYANDTNHNLTTEEIAENEVRKMAQQYERRLNEINSVAIFALFHTADEVSIILSDELHCADYDEAIGRLVRVARDQVCSVTFDHIRNGTRIRATFRRNP